METDILQASCLSQIETSTTDVESSNPNHLLHPDKLVASVNRYDIAYHC